MLRAFQWMLRLYPADYRREFGAEILDVLSQSLGDASRSGFFSGLRAHLREFQGLVAGAAAEHARGWFGKYPWFQFASRRVNMRSEFRYPRSTAPMMLVILACIMAVIYRAHVITAKYELDPGILPSIPLTFALLLLVAGIAGAVGWFILHSLHRSGVHRLSEADTWPQTK